MMGKRFHDSARTQPPKRGRIEPHGLGSDAGDKQAPQKLGRRLRVGERVVRMVDVNAVPRAESLETVRLSKWLEQLIRLECARDRGWAKRTSTSITPTAESSRVRTRRC